MAFNSAYLWLEGKVVLYKDIYHPAENIIRIRNIHLYFFEKVQMRNEQLGLFE